MKKNFFLLIAALLCFNLSAKTIDFRSGTILNAEITSAYVPIENFNKNLYGMNRPDYYAAVTIKLSGGRTVNIYDYTLENSRGVSFPCAAIRTNSGKFVFTKAALKPTVDDDRFTLLFLIKDMNIFNDPTFTLHAAFGPENRAKCELKFKNINSNPLTECEQIKPNGNF